MTESKSVIVGVPKRPRILEVLYSFRVGGSEMVGIDLACQLSRSGADILCSAIDGTEGPLRERCAAAGIPVVDLEIPKQHILGRNGYSWRLVRRLQELKLDAIHLQHLLSLNKLGLAARLAGIKRIVVTEHSEAELRRSLAGRVRVRINWRLCHEITVIHEGIKDYLVGELGVDSARVSVIPIAVDPLHWHRNDRADCRARLGIGAEFVFMFVGRIAEVKNVSGLIKAFLAAKLRHPSRAKLIIVGDGPDMSRSRVVASGHPMEDSVRLMGEQSDARPFLAAADAFIMNSRSEGTPRALLEAMSMGLPAICPSVGGIPSMLQGRGWLTEPNDEESLTAAILDALADPRRAEAYGSQAQAYIASSYDPTEILERYQKILIGRQAQSVGILGAT